MARFSWSLRDINKAVLLVAIASLAYKRGHFAGTPIPSPFQVLFVISVMLTIVYVLRDVGIRTFFQSLPKKVLAALGCLYAFVIVGWGIGSVFLHIPTTVSTIQDFGTFTISIIMFLLVSFYAKEDEKFSKWSLYALLVPNIYPFLFFVTHGFIAYWGAVNDDSLRGLVDPNLFSKTLLLPTLFFMGASLFAAQVKKWGMGALYAIAASLYCMLIFWTASRGSIISLAIGALLLWVAFSSHSFTWKKLIGSAAIISIVFICGFAVVPQGTKQELYAKLTHTGSLPQSTDIGGIFSDPTVTTEDLRDNPRTDVRIFEWSYFFKYGIRHPLGVGPSSSSINYQKGDELQLRPGNTYIQVWLWGGVVAFLSFLYVIRNAFIALWVALKKNFNSRLLALLTGLCALSIAIVFDASLYFYWYFIVLALATQALSFTHES